MLSWNPQSEAMRVTEMHADLDEAQFPHLSSVKIVSADSFLLEASTDVQLVIAGLKSLTSGGVEERYIEMMTGRPELLKALKERLNADTPLYEAVSETIAILLTDEKGQYHGSQTAYLNALLDRTRAYVSAYGSNIKEFLKYWDDTMHAKPIPASSTNAIRILAGLIGRLYAVELPQDGIVTYNVGTIQGGTSVNTIAQEAEMLYEIRSDNRRSMAAVEGYFLSLLDELRQNGTDVSCELLGDRPCAGTVSEDAQNALRTRAADAVARWFGEKASFAPGSTDCNIPLSLGVPSVCVACYRGHGAHTREEYVEQNSLLPGYHLAFVLILQYL